MRERKSSDSPSDATRDVYATRGRVTVASVQHDFAQALTRINDERVRFGGTVPALQDPRDVLALLAALVENARFMESDVALEVALNNVGALAVAARLARARAESMDVTSGGDAA